MILMPKSVENRMEIERAKLRAEYPPGSDMPDKIVRFAYGILYGSMTLSAIGVASIVKTAIKAAINKANRYPYSA